MTFRPISNGGSSVFTAELHSLEAERDPELQAEGLYHLACRAEARSQYALATQIYGRLEGTPLAGRAAERLRVLGGEGTIGQRAEFLLRNLSREAFDPSMLFAMGSAGALFKATRLMTLSRLAAAPAATFTRGFGARALAAGAGFAVETFAFPTAGRLAHLALGQSQDWSGRALGRDLAASVLVLGGMKLGGFASSSLARGVLGESSLSPLAQGLFHQSGMFGGILLGQRFEELAGLRQAVSTSSSLVDALGLLLNFNIAGRLTQTALGEGFRRWERQVEMQTRALSQPLSNPPLPPLFQRGVRDLLSPALAMAGDGESRFLGPQVLMMKGEGRGSADRLPPMIEFSLLNMRNSDPAVWESHLAHLEFVLAEAKLPAREYVALYGRLQAELGENNNLFNGKVASTLSELLTRVPMDRPGPRLLFDRMIHIDRFPDHSLGDTLASWARNPSLESHNRRRMLQLTEDIFSDQPRDYGEEALAFLASNWHRFSGEGRVFRRAVDAALHFIHENDAWFALDGLLLARLALLDPETGVQSRDSIFNQLQSTLHGYDLHSAQRVKVMETLEELARREDINEEQREAFLSRLSVWRNEFLHFNLKNAIQNRVSHHAELAYLITQDYVTQPEKRRFAQAWQRAFFEAPPASQAYSMMIGDALRYLGEPRLTPELRRTFVVPLLKALNDSVDRKIRPFERHVHFMNQQFLIEKITGLPEEERIGLANQLIDDLGRRDGRAEQASILISTLAGLMNPTPELSERLNQAAEASHSSQARDIAREILDHWQSLN